MIVGLSQLAFAVVGEAQASHSEVVHFNEAGFLSSMGDQALVKLSYKRQPRTEQELSLESSLIASKSLKGCRFSRFGLSGHLQGTMDTMLSPRVPIKTQSRSNYHEAN